jgi:hypothetical protein
MNSRGLVLTAGLLIIALMALGVGEEDIAQAITVLALLPRVASFARMTHGFEAKLIGHTLRDVDAVRSPECNQPVQQIAGDRIHPTFSVRHVAGVTTGGSRSLGRSRLGQYFPAVEWNADHDFTAPILAE